MTQRCKSSFFFATATNDAKSYAQYGGTMIAQRWKPTASALKRMHQNIHQIKQLVALGSQEKQFQTEIDPDLRLSRPSQTI